MKDKMIICRKLNSFDTIENVEEWFVKCPPQKKKKHWQPGRSAMETAKIWLTGIPLPFINLLKDHNLSFVICSPEYNSRFDHYRGNVRNHDLLITAIDNDKNNVVIGIESKVDEEFDKTIENAIIAGYKRLIDNPRSKGVDRIQELRQIVFGVQQEIQIPLRYQLLTAVAGILADAQRNKAKKVFFIIQTIISDKINLNKHKRNQDDLNAFISQLSNGKYDSIKRDDLVGPLRISNKTDMIPNLIDLYIGKYEIQM